jgi:hypothetical protein
MSFDSGKLYRALERVFAASEYHTGEPLPDSEVLERYAELQGPDPFDEQLVDAEEDAKELLRLIRHLGDMPCNTHVQVEQLT